MLLKSMTSGETNGDGERIDPRITRSRQWIENAFLELLWQDGFEAMTVRDIAKRAGVNRATFYAHFEDKYALFTHVLEKGLAETIQTRLPNKATFNQENLKLLVLALITFFELGNDAGCASGRNQPLKPMIESRVQEKIGELLLDWLRATPDLHLRATPELTATLVSWMVFGLGLSYVKSGNAKADHAEISKAVEVIMNGAFAEEEMKTNESKRAAFMSNATVHSGSKRYQTATVG